MPTVDQLVERYGYTREAAEKEWDRAHCEHDYGTMCESSFLGCFRTCVKCGQKMGLGRHCGGAGRATTSVQPRAVEGFGGTGGIISEEALAARDRKPTE